ncbi:MAG TPA: hypothetical protein DDY78_23105 [Planctomycetales bacterium]|jgi:hypothetical protein|nr:hypothetical protein [Planctomycetales bacterium]
MADDEFQQEAPEPRRKRPARPAREDDDDVRIRQPGAIETLIPYKNPMGLIAYYLGVFSFIPCVGLLLGPAALVLGIMGIRYRNKHPTAGGLGHAITGVVLGSLTSLGYWGLVAVGIGMAVYG